VTTFDLTQTIFLLNMAANRASDAKGTQQSLTELLALALNQGGKWAGVYQGKQPPSGGWTVTGFLASMGSRLLGGDWTIAWGPSVYVHGTDTSVDNAMFVAHSASQNMYVVSICATDPISWFDWLDEDADVLPNMMVNAPVDLTTPIDQQHVWPNWLKPQFSGGTALGVYDLCNNLADPKLGNIAKFLDAVAKDANTRLIFTGHSLAGALSPALAYQLWAGLKTAGWQNVFVVPTAGATAGNLAFVFEWKRNLPQKMLSGLNDGNRLTTLNTLYWNTLDLVPHAWTHLKEWYSYDPSAPDVMQTNLGQFDGGKDECEFLNDVMAAASDTATYVDGLTRLPNASFTGTWPVTYWAGSAWASYAPAVPYTSLLALGDAVDHAHTDQYYELVGIPRDAVPAPIST
jgi:hypothetical protein